MTTYKGLDGPGSFPTYEPGPNTTPLPDRPLTEAEIMEKLREAFGMPAPTPEPAEKAQRPETPKDRLRRNFGFPEPAEKAYNPNQPRDLQGSPTGGQWTSTGAAGASAGRGEFVSSEANTLMTQLISGGGFSYQPFDDISPTTGAMLSIYEARARTFKTASVSAEDMLSFVEDNADLLSKSDHFFGGWVTGENAVFDVSIRVEDRDEAHRLCCEFHQDAYYDLDAVNEDGSHGKEVFVDDC